MAELGIRAALRTQWPKGRGGSIPLVGIKYSLREGASGEGTVADRYRRQRGPQNRV